MKYINLSSLVRNSNENDDILSLSAKKGFALDFTIVNTSGALNDYSISEESSFKFTTATNITGFSGGFNGKFLYIYNGNNSSVLILNNNSLSSLSQNRILTNTGEDLEIPINGGVILQYDSDSSVWRIIGGSGGGGGSVGSGSSVTFTSSIDFSLGSPIYFSSSGTWQLAKADLDTTSVQFVVSQKTGSGTISYTALSSGEITLTTGQWDIITNSSGGLISSSTYFLSSSTAGKISTNAGLIYAPVLRALSSTKAFVSLSINSIESGMGDTFYRDTVTTVANTSAITLTYPPAGKAYTWLSIDGAIQSGIDFDLAGNTLTLGATVPSGTLIDVLYARAVLLADSNAINKMVAFSETVTGSAKTTFNLPSVPSGLNSCIVFVGGSIQDTSKFNLSGNILSMSDSVPVGVQLVAYILNSSGVSNSIDSYVNRQSYNLSANGAISISTIFGSQSTGFYRFFDMNDPRISGTISLKHNGVGFDPDIRVDSNSSLISITINTASKVNIYISSNLLTFQNLTSNTVSLRMYREI
jgi:hypothetical protein